MAMPQRLRDYAPREVEPERAFGGGFLLVAAAALVLGFGVVLAIYFLRSPGPEPISDAVAAAIASATAPRTEPADPSLRTLPDDGEWTDADLKHCSEEAEAAGEIASKRKLAAVSADRVGLGAPDPKMVERAANLLCSARTKPLHLCQPYWRDRLLEAIRVYASDFRNVSSSAYWTKVSLAERARADITVDAETLQVMADDIDQTTRDVAKMHEEIATTIRALVRDGIVSLDDFGVFFGMGVPPEISALLGNGRAERHVCG
jgi:hypothetical protein